MCNEKENLRSDYCRLFENTIISKLSDMHKENPYTVPDQTGKNSKVCFVFSCPGRMELIKNKVCQGETGDNLNELLKILNGLDKEVFSSTTKDDYDILNATNIVHFYALDGRTEGTHSEINKPINQQRIKEILKNNTNLEYVILFGNKAQIVKELFNDYKVITSRHLSFQSINQITEDVKNNSLGEIDDPSKRTKKRLEVVAAEIIDEINNIKQ